MMVFFFFKQKTAYELLISDWSSDVCSSYLADKAIDAERESERQADPQGIERPREQDRNPDPRDRHRQQLQLRQPLAEEDHAEHHIDERVEIIAEARREHMVGEDRIDIDEPVDRDQQRAREQQPQRPPILEHRQIFADLPPEEHDDETERQRPDDPLRQHLRSEEHTSELQSLMRSSYAVLCLN